ncbi:GDP-mannose 4,6-dehydratase [Rhodococcoides corynebacterioides]|uniref:GDP-mannose 4,6-dehydratase n=1 Tax=Rhodococcoides corynebacterioides TaxID=53972 RepID=UPI003AEBEF8D
MATYLITGVAGFIGSHLAERLLGDSHSVIGIDNFSDYYPRECKQRNIAPLSKFDRFHFQEMDLKNFTPDHLTGVDHVVHLAAQPGVRDSWNQFETYLDDNLLATNQLLQSVVASSVNRVVMASSSSVYGDQEAYPTHEDSPLKPRSPYGVTKLATEALGRAYTTANDLEIAAMRFFTVYGPRQRPDMATHRLIEASLNGTEFTLYGDGSARRDFTYVSDIAQALVAACNSSLPEKFIPLNVGGTGDTSMAALIRLIEQTTHKPIRIRRVGKQVGDVDRTGADCSRAAEVLGWKPSVSIENGIRLHVEALQSGAHAR